MSNVDTSATGGGRDILDTARFGSHGKLLPRKNLCGLCAVRVEVSRLSGSCQYKRTQCPAVRREIVKLGAADRIKQQFQGEHANNK